MLWLFAWIGAALQGQAAYAAPDELPSEYRLKAAFLYRIGQFVEWPETPQRAGDSAFTICVLGSNPFGESLRELSTRSLGARPIALLYPSSASEARLCQIVYTDLPTKKTVLELSALLADSPVLTVGGAAQFVDAGGGIGFVVVDGKLRLEINLDVLKRANLKPSAKLVEVAVRTVGGAKGRP
ncbi:YfiR family protein [Paucibacter sp. TC2R-5]|uniref:YfiR family protein n=1 Tax=Paucibacter sp. TC2R-5 TaxID=2893555 RepID=UPI0021E3ACFB|nr:YfiR family protein [Paucibacter sp. TC2R-5]MCV2359187.1 YfiR family protein [Paucibacter sp. TC2R-5]